MSQLILFPTGGEKITYSGVLNFEVVNSDKYFIIFEYGTNTVTSIGIPFVYSKKKG